MILFWREFLTLIKIQAARYWSFSGTLPWICLITQQKSINWPVVHQFIFFDFQDLFMVTLWAQESSLGQCKKDYIHHVTKVAFLKMHLMMLSAQFQPFYAGLSVLIFVVLRTEYSKRTLSVAWLLMPWLLVSPGHLQAAAFTFSM